MNCLYKLSAFVICLISGSLLFLPAEKTQAQIVITQADVEASFAVPLLATENVSQDAENLNALIEISGENQVWDFTDLTYNAYVEGTYSLTENVGDVPMGDDDHFSQADAVIVFDFHYVQDEDHDGPWDQTLYGFLGMDGNQAVTKGTVSTMPESDDLMVFRSTPYEVDFEFPTEYGSTWEFSYVHSIEMTGFTDETDYDVTVEVDGWGELITPEGSFDVLRIKFTEVSDMQGTVLTEESYRFVDANGRQKARIEVGPGGIVSDGAYFTFETANSTDPITDLPKETVLKQNYPNPFNPTTNIRYELPESEQVSLTVYDLTGREVAVLINNQTMPGGAHSVSFDAADLSSGVYLYRLQLGSGHTYSQKMTLIK